MFSWCSRVRFNLEFGGHVSENVSLRVISAVAKFHAFIINLNNFGR